MSKSSIFSLLYAATPITKASIRSDAPSAAVMCSQVLRSERKNSLYMTTTFFIFCPQSSESQKMLNSHQDIIASKTASFYRKCRGNKIPRDKDADLYDRADGSRFVWHRFPTGEDQREQRNSSLSSETTDRTGEHDQ